MKRIQGIVVLILLLSGCATQGGQSPSMPLPQKAQTYAQPTIKSLTSASISQPTYTEPTATLIHDRPGIMAQATVTPDGIKTETWTLQDALNQAQDDVAYAQKLAEDCSIMATREHAEDWVVDCTLIIENLAEANRRLASITEVAETEEGKR